MSALDLMLQVEASEYQTAIIATQAGTLHRGGLLRASDGERIDLESPITTYLQGVRQSSVAPVI
jgi:hypothetical protein